MQISREFGKVFFVFVCLALSLFTAVTFVTVPFSQASTVSSASSGIVQYSYTLSSCWECAIKATVTLSESVTKGDLIVALSSTEGFGQDGTVLSDSMGNNYTVDVGKSMGPGDLGMTIYYAYAKASGPLNVTFTYGGGFTGHEYYAGSFVYELSGFTPATSETSQGYSIFSYHPYGPCCKVARFNLSSSSSRTLVVAVAGNLGNLENDNPEIWSPGYSWHLIIPTSASSISASEYKFATGQSTTASMSVSVKSPWTELAAAFVAS
jgi:hypothetical protein